MRVEKSSTTVFTPLDDGTGVVLNVDTLVYYRLNRTGVALWKEIEAQNPFTLDDLLPAMCERFEIDRDEARREVAAFVERLEALRILRVF
jgi:hypothetical protein